MSPEQRIVTLKAGFGEWKMHQGARYIAPFWWVEPRQSRVLHTPPGIRVHNGTAFFAKIGEQIFCITAAHVYRGYLDAKAAYPSLKCQLGDGGTIFDPESALYSIGEYRDGRYIVDIATFRVTPEFVAGLNKEPVIAPDSQWPPRHPFSKQEASLLGYPASSRLWLDARSISFGNYYAGPQTGAASDRQITFPFEREAWIDTLGNGLPPTGMNLGGISGGPLLFLTEQGGDWSFNVGGVISEMPQSPHYETVIVSPAHFIGTDGSVLDERSAPVSHYVETP